MGQREHECKSCGLRFELTGDYVQDTVTTLTRESSEGLCTFRLQLAVCPNQACKALSAVVSMYRLEEDASGTLRLPAEPAKVWPLIPSTSARPMPSFVPERIAKEYAEACALLELSPNAAATYARRCLQAIIRDFFNIKKNSLADELEALREKLEPEAWEAIDAARKTGTVGKNMEKGVNLIVDTDPDEPKVLIGLIQFFVQECYIARHERKQRLEAMMGRSSLTPKS